jgi:hypothetical protein
VRGRLKLGFVLALVALLAPAAAHAVDPFEIQVYEGDSNAAGQVGLELHSNFVGQGRSTPAFVGEAVPEHSFHFTLEPSLGVLPFWELGAYLQFVTAPWRSQADFGGFKLRSKFIAPHAPTSAFTYGLNLEVGHGVRVLGSRNWDSEVRPIFAYGRDRWFVAVNPILSWELTGDASWAPSFEPCAKLRYAASPHVGLGFEYYAGLGRISELLPWKQQEHFLYLAGDLLDGPVELNVGVGRGLTAASDEWIVKAIVGKAF